MPLRCGHRPILAGPDSMELGWLVSMWIPILRNRWTNKQDVVVVCDPANEYLYSDFCDTFEHYTRKGQHDQWYVSRYPTVKNKLPKHLKEQYKGYRFIEPNKTRMLRKRDNTGCLLPCTYFRYGFPYGPDITEYEIVIHARAENKYNQEYRNWPKSKYARVLEKCGNPRAASVGLKGKAHHIEGTDDLRGVPYQTLCETLAAARTVIGPSSGPMHLAHTCGAPIIVWTDNKPLPLFGPKRRTNRWRYETAWRAFHTPVIVVDDEGWQPSVKKIVGEIKALWQRRPKRFQLRQRYTNEDCVL